MEDEIKELKSVLRSLVVSSPTQVDVRTLMRDYRSIVGRAVPIAKLGYKDPVHFLRERCSDCFLVSATCSQAMIRCRLIYMSNSLIVTLSIKPNRNPATSNTLLHLKIKI